MVVNNMRMRDACVMAMKPYFCFALFTLLLEQLPQCRVVFALFRFLAIFLFFHPFDVSTFRYLFTIRHGSEGINDNTHMNVYTYEELHVCCCTAVCA